MMCRNVAVNSYKPTLRNMPEERRPRLHCGGRLISRLLVFINQWVVTPPRRLYYTVYSRIQSALVFVDFLTKKQELVRGSNSHLWEDDGEDKDDSDWVTDNDSVTSDDESGE